jgi:hypothetical protein
MRVMTFGNRGSEMTIRKTLSIFLTSGISLAIALAFVAGTVSISTSPAWAEDDASIARGGKLYDKWYKVIKADGPKENHPAWPASNTKKKGGVTHRCKSCHGWDGLGKDGAYASGSYKTGIKGVNGMIGADTAKIIAVMKDKTHGYAGKMDDKDYMDLAMFVSKGQVDMKKYIDYGAKKSKGNAAKGAAYYNTICAGCHGMKGELPKDMPKPLGGIGNPQEFIHKILNGQPGEPMPALLALDVSITADILAHIDTLPKEK